MAYPSPCLHKTKCMVTRKNVNKGQPQRYILAGLGVLAMFMYDAAIEVMFTQNRVLAKYYSSREASESGPKAQTRERSKARFIKSRVKNTSMHMQTKLIQSKVPTKWHMFRSSR